MLQYISGHFQIFDIPHVKFLLVFLILSSHFTPLCYPHSQVTPLRSHLVTFLKRCQYSHVVSIQSYISTVVHLQLIKFNHHTVPALLLYTSTLLLLSTSTALHFYYTLLHFYSTLIHFYSTLLLHFFAFCLFFGCPVGPGNRVDLVLKCIGANSNRWT